MYVFICADCETELTTALTQVARPVHAHQRYGNDVRLPVLMDPGTYALDDQQWGRSEASRGAVVVAPGDVLNTVTISEASTSACCGLDGASGPNMACDGCGRMVATRIDDCSLWQSVRLSRDAVERVRVDTEKPVLTWENAVSTCAAMPPMESVLRYAFGHDWTWSPRWEAAVGQALAHLLVVSDGHRVVVPDGVASLVLQRHLDHLSPGVLPARVAVVAGPGVPDRRGDILLVPTHPQDGRIWAPLEDRGAICVGVPLDVWHPLAFPEPVGPLQGRGRSSAMLDLVDPPTPSPGRGFLPDAQIFVRTLAGLPTADTPWLQALLEHAQR